MEKEERNKKKENPEPINEINKAKVNKMNRARAFSAGTTFASTVVKSNERQPAQMTNLNAKMAAVNNPNSKLANESKQNPTVELMTAIKELLKLACFVPDLALATKLY